MYPGPDPAVYARIRLLYQRLDLPGYELLAKNAPGILNFKISPSESADLYDQVFNDFFAWVLIYLDAPETNLYILKSPFTAVADRV